MKQSSIILFSSDDWGWKTSKYQLAIRFARDNTVLFVSSVGFRAPSVSKADLGRIWRKLVSFFKGVKAVHPNLYVLTPLVIPFRRGGSVERLNTLLLRVQLAWACVKLGMGAPYIFVFSQNWHDFVLTMKRKILVYYCVDNQAGFTGVDALRFQEKDVSFTTRADLVLCSSRKLFERKRQINAHTRYLPHGVNYQLFSQALFDSGLPVASDAAGLSAPVLGFYGHISYDWVDVGLLKFLARKRPGWTIILLGRYSLQENEFAGLSNIVYLGEKDFEALPGYCKVMDVALIPFVVSPLTQDCNPLKLYEYLAAGLPVVSTEIPEVRAFGGDVHVAGTHEEFLALCERALVDDSDQARAARSRSVAKATWDDRIDAIYEASDGL
jgi:glycosyltransferase involved in cell wall biosynthesis